MLNCLQVKNCFNNAHETYDKNSYIQQLIGEELIDNLNNLKLTHGNILELGCGTGLLTAKLANIYNNFNKFYAIDIAENLLELAKQRLKETSVILQQENFEEFKHKEILFDLVFSNMSLQWAKNLSYTLININKNLSTKGILAFSLPVEGTFYELDKEIILPLYKFETVKSKLEENGFKTLNHFEYIKTFSFRSFIPALRSIKNVGANYYPRTNQVNRLIKFRKLVHKPFCLTYKVGIFIAIKVGNLKWH